MNTNINFKPNAIKRTDLSMWSPREVREAIRAKRWCGTTHGASRGHLQANLVVLPKEFAFDFWRFCLLNPKPCPVLDVTAPGDPEPRFAVPNGDIRTDLSAYREYRDGKLVETHADLIRLWRSDMVGFLMGCSLSFDDALDSNGIAMKHLYDEKSRVATYRSTIPCKPAGIFSGPMVVTMRAIPSDRVVDAIEITGQYPLAHGAPVHIGDSEAIGIKDVTKPEFVPYFGMEEDTVPVFWGCGVTPQAVAMAAGVPLMYTHAAGHMLVTDLGLDGRRRSF